MDKTSQNQIKAAGYCFQKTPIIVKFLLKHCQNIKTKPRSMKPEGLISTEKTTTFFLKINEFVT